MFEDLNNLPILEPPPHGFKVFQANQPGQMNACLNFKTDMIYGYVEGYRLAAEKLVEQVEQSGTHQDLLVYPIVFLYRHHLELSLKRILELLIAIDERKQSVPKIHDLVELWNECRLPLQKFSGSDETVWSDAVTECLKQIQEEDPNADGFRFYRSKDGTPSLKEIKYVNLHHLREVMTPICGWLSGAHDHLSEIKSHMPEDEY